MVMVELFVCSGNYCSDGCILGWLHRSFLLVLAISAFTLSGWLAGFILEGPGRETCISPALLRGWMGILELGDFSGIALA